MQRMSCSIVQSAISVRHRPELMRPELLQRRLQMKEQREKLHAFIQSKHHSKPVQEQQPVAQSAAKQRVVHSDRSAVGYPALLSSHYRIQKFVFRLTREFWFMP